MARPCPSRAAAVRAIGGDTGASAEHTWAPRLPQEPEGQPLSRYSLSLLLIKPPRNARRERKYLKYLPIIFLQ